MSKLAIIIPIYNVGGELLSRCLNSIAKAKNIYKNLVVILVDDASPKWSEEYAVIDKYLINPIIVYHSENKGLGAARNTGLNVAIKHEVDWVWFVDSDDSINAGCLPLMFRDMKGAQDIIQLGMNNVTDSGKLSKSYFSETPDYRSLSGPSALSKNELIPPSACCKLYRLSFLVGNNIRFPEGTYYEDQEFLVDSMSGSTMVLLDTKLLAYNYHFNPSSIMNCDWDEKHILDAWKVVYVCRKKVKKMAEIYTHYDYTARLNEYKYTEDLGNDSYRKLSIFGKTKCKVKYLIWRISQ